jgi:hypothetical protein
MQQIKLNPIFCLFICILTEYEKTEYLLLQVSKYAKSWHIIAMNKVA